MIWSRDRGAELLGFMGNAGGGDSKSGDYARAGSPLRRDWRTLLGRLRSSFVSLWWQIDATRPATLAARRCGDTAVDGDTVRVDVDRPAVDADSSTLTELPCSAAMQQQARRVGASALDETWNRAVLGRSGTCIGTSVPAATAEPTRPAATLRDKRARPVDGLHTCFHENRRTLTTFRRARDAAAPGAKQPSRRALTARPTWPLPDRSTRRRSLARTTAFLTRGRRVDERNGDHAIGPR
jgi:hypothetical protein